MDPWAITVIGMMTLFAVLMIYWFIATAKINRQIDQQIYGLRCITKGHHAHRHNKKTRVSTCKCGYRWRIYL